MSDQPGGQPTMPTNEPTEPGSSRPTEPTGPSRPTELTGPSRPTEPIVLGQPTQPLHLSQDLSSDDAPLDVPGRPAPVPTSAGDAWTSGSPSDPFTPARARRRASKGVLAGVAAVAMVGLLGSGAYAAYQKVLGGGGAQPESAFPASAVAFAKIDLDPAGSQKIDALRFARKFPDAPADVRTDDVDLRKLVFEQIQKSGELTDLRYDTDVKPWIGDRFGVAVLPGAEGTEPVPLFALAVTDAGKAKTALAKVGSDAHCTVGADFALCGEDQVVVAKATRDAAKAPLADAKQFSGDMNDLGEDGIVAFWSDLSATAKLASTLGGTVDQPQLDQVKGRMVGALRFDGPNLELAGRATGSATALGEAKGTGVTGLPTDTLVAGGLAGGGDSVRKQWDQLSTTGGQDLADGVSEIQRRTGFKLPDDLSTLLGTTFTVAFGGMDGDQQPEIAMLTDAPTVQVQSLADRFATAAPDAPPVTVQQAKGRTVVAMSQPYADAVASGSGLGEAKAFKAAVPNADDAGFVLYADIAGLVNEFGSDLSDEDRKSFEPLQSAGLSVSSKGDHADFLLRLTTR